MSAPRAPAFFLALTVSMLCAAQPAAQAPPPQESRLTSLPAKGLFDGDKLTPAARSKLVDLILNALSLQIEVALVVPVGPWNVDGSGSGKDERDLTPARLAAVKKFLHERGVDPKKVYVESRIDDKVKEPRLDVQVIGRPATD